MRVIRNDSSMRASSSKAPTNKRRFEVNPAEEQNERENIEMGSMRRHEINDC